MNEFKIMNNLEEHKRNEHESEVYHNIKLSSNNKLNESSLNLESQTDSHTFLKKKKLNFLNDKFDKSDNNTLDENSNRNFTSNPDLSFLCDKNNSNNHNCNNVKDYLIFSNNNLNLKDNKEIYNSQNPYKNEEDPQLNFDFLFNISDTDILYKAFNDYNFNEINQKIYNEILKFLPQNKKDFYNNFFINTNNCLKRNRLNEIFEYNKSIQNLNNILENRINSQNKEFENFISNNLLLNNFDKLFDLFGEKLNHDISNDNTIVNLDSLERCLKGKPRGTQVVV